MSNLCSNTNINIINQCYVLLGKLEIPISNSVFFKECSGHTRYGYCSKEGCCKRTGYDYEIAINKNLINENDIKATIIHELLHTIHGCSNHNALWKDYAKLCTEKLGIIIQVKSNYELKKESVANNTKLCSINLFNSNTMNLAECPICHSIVCVSKKIKPNAKGEYNYICKKCKAKIIQIK